MPEAQRLRKLFEYVAERLHLTLDVVITDGRQPIGHFFLEEQEQLIRWHRQFQ